MKGTMPAIVNMIDGSLETRDADGTTVWPFFSKKSSHLWVISSVFMRRGFPSSSTGARLRAALVPGTQSINEAPSEGVRTAVAACRAP